MDHSVQVGGGTEPCTYGTALGKGEKGTEGRREEEALEGDVIKKC